jgi:hypothetical protein
MASTTASLERPSVDRTSVENQDVEDEKHDTRHIEVSSAAVALAAAAAVSKPRKFSPGMIKLWIVVRPSTTLRNSSSIIATAC